MLLHQSDDLTKWRLLGNVDHLLGHDVAGTQRVGFGELPGLFIDTAEKRDPASPMLLRADLGPPQEIPLAYHPDECAIVV